MTTVSLNENDIKNDMYSVLQFNKPLLKELVINLFSISKFLGISEGTTYCPFHQDKYHKSAKVYEDEDGISRLYCFGQCQTQYTSYDYIRKVLRRDPIKYLLKEFPISQISEYIKNYQEKPVVDNVKTEYVKNKWNESEGDLIKFIDKVYFNE